MARRVEVYTVTDDNRDKGKKFVLTEMPAAKGELFAMRAFLAMAKSGVEVPDNIKDAGMAGLATYGLNMLGGLPFDEAQVLMAELWDCVAFQPDPKHPEYTRPPIDDDTEELSTRANIRMRLLSLHFGFFKDAVLSKVGSLAAASESQDSPNTQTSPSPSQQ